MRHRDSATDRGNITIMSVGFFTILGLLGVVVINASAAFLERQELAGLADRAALHAADQLDLGEFYRDPSVDRLRVDPGEAARVANEVLPPDVSAVVTVDGTDVHVRVERRVSLPIRPPGMPGSAKIVSESTSALIAR